MAHARSTASAADSEGTQTQCKVPSRTCRHEIVEIVMPTACGSLDVTTESEPPFLQQDGLKLNRNVVRREFSGEMAGNWRTLEIDNEEG